MPGAKFFDTNVLVYASSLDENKAALARGLLLRGGVVSIQVLKKFASVSSRKQRLSWERIRFFLDGVGSRSRVVALDERVHDAALGWVDRYQLSFYDGLIVATTLEAHFAALYTEDLDAGLVIDGRLTVVNPFA